MTNIYTRLVNKTEIDTTTGCWNYQGCKNNIGYGMFRLSKKLGMTTAHKAMFEEYYQTKIPKNNVVIHSCFNYLCINPDHLSIGTRKDVTRHMMKHDRQDFYGSRSRYKCMYCDTVTTKAMLHRWHNDKCKNNPIR